MALFGLGACAGQPAWVLRPEQHGHGGRYVVAVGSASLTQGASRARIVAEQSARAALAARVRTQVSATVLDSMREQLDHSSGRTQSVESMSQSLNTSVQESLEGVEILELYEDADRDVLYALAALDLQRLRERVQLWQSERDLQMSSADQRVRRALADTDLLAVDAALRDLGAVDTDLPGFVRTLLAFDPTVQLPEGTVARSREQALDELRRQWPKQNPQPDAAGTLHLRLPTWKVRSWQYRLRPAGGDAQSLGVDQPSVSLTLPQDVYTDGSGRVTLELWPEPLGDVLAHAYVVQWSQVRPAAIEPQIEDQGCGEVVRTAVKNSLAKCLSETGWRVGPGDQALAPRYVLSCEAVQNHDFGAGALLSTAVALSGGSEAGGRAPVLDYRAVAVATTEAQLRSSAAERIARAACAGIH